MIELQGSHSGENLADEVFWILDIYHIKDRLGYFVMDNATANDRMLSCISNHLMEKDGILYDAKQHRLRCNGHIINLSVQAFLFGKMHQRCMYKGG